VGINRRSTVRLALILCTAVATPAVLARAIWTRLSSQLSVQTDIVGYPTLADFNIERYYERYWLVVGFVPLVTLALFLVLDRFVPGRRARRPRTREAEPDPIRTSASSGWATAGRVALIGAILGVELATVIRREHDWIWTVGLPTTALYGALIAALGRWIRTLPGKDRRERADAANALAAPLLIVGLLGAAAGTRVVGPDREWSFDWLPVWLALALALVPLAWIALQIRAGDAPPTIGRRVALLISGPVAIFLSISALPGALGRMDMFHEGEALAAADLFRDGAFPWRDLIFIHGLLNDVLAPLVGMTVFEDSRWGAAAGGLVLVVPLYWIAVYAFCAYVFRQNWLFLVISQVAVFATVASFDHGEFEFLFGTHLRFLAIPLVLISLIALLRRATAVRAAVFSGLMLIQTILAPEAAIAGVIFFLAVVGYDAIRFQRGLPLRRNFRRTGLTIAFGSIQLAIWCAFLAWYGALDDFFSVYLTFASSHELTGALPLQPSGTEYWLAMYVPPVAALAMLTLIVVQVFGRWQVSAEDWGLGAMALFVLAYYHKFLARADGHVFQVAAVSLPLVLYVVFRAVDAIDRLFDRINMPTHVRIPRRAAIALLLLVTAVSAPSISRTLEALPTRLEATTVSAPTLSSVGFATNDAVDETTIHDFREIARFYLKSDDTVFDFSNTPALFHYILELRPATRYYNVSLAIRRKTQLDLIKELEQNRPKLVFFPGTITGPPIGLPTWDGVSNPIRHYEVSEWILDRYRPVIASHGFLVLIPKSAPSPPVAALRRRLSEPPRTDLLYDRSLPCTWGYVPNFLSAEPKTKGTVLKIEPANDSLLVRGWAADLGARKPAKLVLVALGKRIVGWATPHLSRPDVERYLGGQAFRRSGYEVKVPWRRIVGPNGTPDFSNLRVYGLLYDGRAVGLAHGALAGWQPTAPAPAELTLGAGHFPVLNEAAQGAVDESTADLVSVRVPSFAPYGWLEIESSQPLATNDFIVSAEDNPNDAVTFSTLDRGERRVRVRVGACTQWFGYRDKRLLIRSRVDPHIKAVRLYR
jgi:hypothetical protein